MDLEMNTTLVRNQTASTAPIDDELVILNMKGNNYLTLDDIGRHIWEQLAEPISVGDLCKHLTSHYSGNPQQIVDDTLTFLKRLVKDDLIHVVTA